MSTIVLDKLSLECLPKMDLLNLLVDEKSVIFCTKSLETKLNVLYGNLAELGLCGVETINDIIKRIDVKSEITEILGIDEFLENINKNLASDDGSKIYLPINVENERRVYSFKAIRRNNLIICYIQLVDSDTLDIERLYSDSYKDSLTYLFNKNALEFHLAKNEGYHYVGFLDLDNFKMVNDTYSHHMGNELLTEIGKKLIAISDKNVIYYRYGGDEFVFITIDLTYIEVIALANKIKNAVASIDFHGITPTFSIGISEFMEESLYSINDAVKIADIAMYRAKYNGKNRMSYIDSKEANKLCAEGNLDDVLESQKRLRR